jgi:hypothetical protein
MLYLKKIITLNTRTLLLWLLLCLPGYLFPVSLTVQHDTANLCPVHFLSRYLQFPSITGQEGAAGEFFAGACRDAGLHVRIFSAA